MNKKLTINAHDVRTGIYGKLKKDGASEKGSLLPPTFISSSAEYIVSLFN